MTKFVLPKTQQARNWVRSTDALRDHLRHRLSTVRERADKLRKDAEDVEREGVQLEQAIALLDQLLPPKPASAAREIQAIAAIPTDGSPQVNKRWSLMWDACRNCQRTSVKHLSRGLCATCYTNPEIRAKFGSEAEVASA